MTLSLYVLPDTTLAPTDKFLQENILVDHDCHPRLVDYGFPLQITTGSRIALPTEGNDIFALGTVVYEVGNRILFAERSCSRPLGTHGSATLL